MSKTNNFNRIAPFYDLMARAVFGQVIHQAPKVFFEQLPEVESILVVGGGSGLLLKDLQNHFKTATVTYVEPSSRMMAMARSRTSNPIAVDFMETTLEDTVLPDSHFQLIITSFVLDLFAKEHLNQVMTLLFNKIKPQGHWLHCDFYVHDQSPRWQQWLLKSMYYFFWFTTNLESRELQDFSSYFQKFPLSCRASRGFYGDMIRSYWYQKTGTGC